MVSIKSIEGIKPAYQEKLLSIGIRTTDQLLEAGATSTGRMRIADEAHLSETQVKEWVHRADLLRIHGISHEVADLLARVGACTVPKLAYRQAVSLHDDLVSYNAAHHVVKHVPTVGEVEAILKAAKRLPKMIHH